MSTALHQTTGTNDVYITFAILGYGKFLARTPISLPKALHWIQQRIRQRMSNKQEDG